MKIDIDFNDIISIMLSPDLQEKLFVLKVVFLAVSAFLLLSIIYFALRTHYFQWLFVQDFWEFFTFRPFGAKRITRIWNKILKRLETGMESEYKLAVIEADDMLDASLKRMGYMGQGLEDRLSKLTSATLPNIDDVYNAHKTRNNIVHNPDYRLTYDEAKATMDVYSKAFEALQILT